MTSKPKMRAQLRHRGLNAVAHARSGPHNFPGQISPLLPVRQKHHLSSPLLVTLLPGPTPKAPVQQEGVGSCALQERIGSLPRLHG